MTSGSVRLTLGTVLDGPWPRDMRNEDGGILDLEVDSDTAPCPPHRFQSIQQAVDQAIRDATDFGPDRRRRIVVRPGFYPGPVLIPQCAPPLSVIGPGAEHATVAARIDAGMPGPEYQARFGKRFEQAPRAVREIYGRIAARERITTGNSAVVRVESDDIAITGLTIRNDYACDRVASAPAGAKPDLEGRFAQGQHQAVALHIAGADRVSLSALRLTSFQDTLYLQARALGPARVHLDRCEIEGDVDFIFGGATAFFETCEIRSRGTRGAQSWALAPSTSLRRAFGFVFDRCRFTHDGAETGRAGRSFLGRQWFEGVRATPYGEPTVSGYRCLAGDVDRYEPPTGWISRHALEAVGKCIVQNSTLGAHINPTAPWDAWASGAWSPRYRPVQAASADFLRLLSRWLEENKFDDTDLDPSDCWLELIGCHPNPQGAHGFGQGRDVGHDVRTRPGERSRSQQAP